MVGFFYLWNFNKINSLYLYKYIKIGGIIMTMKFKQQIKERLDLMKEQIDVAKVGMEKKTIPSDRVYAVLSNSSKTIDDILAYLNRE
jgi:hypothetical protein